MNRRTFITLCAATSGMLSRVDGASANNARLDLPDLGLFPTPPLAKKLVAVTVPSKLSWDETVLYTSLQGIVNRTDPRIYFVQDENDRFWLEYYQQKYGIAHTVAEGLDAVLAQFVREAGGYIVYDPQMLDSANVATTVGALEGWLPVSPDLAPLLKRAGLKKRNDYVGRWNDRYEAYRWAHRNLFRHCHRHLLGTMCVDLPLWPSDSLPMRDYLIAHRIFTFDLSASMRDRVDREMLTKFFRDIDAPACALGWRCGRCNEHEMVALAAQHDVYVQACAHVRNLTVHTAIPRREEPYRQRHINAADVGPVEDKIYIASMATDGDAAASMLQLHGGRFNDPGHGAIPWAFGFLPSAVDFLPGVAECLFERKLDNDYFVVPSSGAFYTYPDLLPNPAPYYAMTRHYMKRADLRVAYMINWIDEFWWQEMDLPEFVEELRREFPDCIGFLRGQGESAFERQYIGEGAPYIMTGEGIHRDSDVYAEFKQFIDANPQRPLFIFCMSNHTMPLEKAKAAFDRISTDEIRLVRMDEFMHLVTKAHQQGRIRADDFYPDKSGLKKLLAQDGRAQWPEVRRRIVEHAEVARWLERDYRATYRDPLARVILDRSATKPADIVAYNAIWDSMALVKAALNVREQYVNNKARAVTDFIQTFSGTEGIEVVPELWALWENWSSQYILFSNAREYVIRLEQALEAVEGKLALA